MTVHTAATNTTSAYGWVERAFHWSIAVLIVTAFVLGNLAYDAPFDTDAALAQKAWLFSFHKTVGVTIFFVALARIFWAISQPRPRPLHGGIEGFLAGAVHWLLYGSLVLVPLLGWSEHAATTGFAPIWWPFGQTLPFVPQDAELAARLAVLHTTFVKVLAAAVILHVLGAIKHVVIDRDQTMARMWRGTDPGPLAQARGHVLPLGAAALVWLATFGVGMVLTPHGASIAAPTEAAQVDGVANWEVTEGTLSITVAQLGSPVTGTFGDWQAAIDFDEAARADGTHGTVEVAISTGTLTLGSVTPQATSSDFLSSVDFPTATFAGVIRSEGEGYVAEGPLTIRGVEVPLVLPFTLAIDGDVATMAGQVALDRRDFGMGETYPDESSVGFAVTVDVALIAQRTP
ncbi:cytochrome b/b6 domain-containing protein [Jannaschia pohangensis]|uniref:Cytochrome b561 n=1 Tax=Jannaschia pohangensis TaxID=390807 RepID=A0A1I3HUH0_9RHOB|nr:cytochrome b/b6 domain-containing protein [Jannaschia pohangensis]SFI39312.1 Cytochrome b561 [Jannaschia pohangensis]